MNAADLIRRGFALGLSGAQQGRLAGVTPAHLRNVANGRRRLSTAAALRLEFELDRIDFERRHRATVARIGAAVLETVRAELAR